MTYYPPIIDNNYYARVEPTGNSAVSIDSMPRYNSLAIRSFSTTNFNTPQNTVVISTAIRPQIDIAGVQYVDFYAHYGGTTTTQTTLRFRIREFDTIGNQGASGWQLGGVVNSFGTSGAGYTTGDQTITDAGLTKYVLTFGSSFTLKAGSTYFVDIQSRNTSTPTTTTHILGSSLGSASEIFYRDRVEISGCTVTNTGSNITVPSGYAGYLYPGIRVVHPNINGGAGANVASCPSTTTAILESGTTYSAASYPLSNQTIYLYDLNRFVTAGADTFTTTAGSGTLPRVLDFIPLFQLRGTG